MEERTDHVTVYKAHHTASQYLNNKQYRKFWEGYFEYSFNGVSPDFGTDGQLKTMWEIVRGTIDRGIAQQHGGKKGGKSSGEIRRAANAKNTFEGTFEPTFEQYKCKCKGKYKEEGKEEAPKKSAPRFTPPTETEAQEYANSWIAEKDLNATFDACRFIAFYESKGWLVGKTKMKDWKSAVRSWILRDATETAKGHPTPEKPREKVYKCPECGGRVFKNTNSGKYECTACYEVFDEPI